jgi:hypothetical protein
MILIEPKAADGLPTLRQISGPEIVRLAVRAAYPDMPPVRLEDMAAALRAGSSPVWAFLTLEEAQAWARGHTGPGAADLRFLVSDYAATRAAAPTEEMDPQLYEVGHGRCVALSKG